jgi:hypothetical protein
MKRAIAVFAAIALAFSGAGGVDACAHQTAAQTDGHAHHSAGHDAVESEQGTAKTDKECCPDTCVGGLACKGCIALSAIAAPAPATPVPSPLAEIDPQSDDIALGDNQPGEPPPPRT